MVLLFIYIQYSYICLQSLHRLRPVPLPLQGRLTDHNLFGSLIKGAPTVNRRVESHSLPQTSRPGSHLGGAGNVGANYGAGLLKRCCSASFKGSSIISSMPSLPMTQGTPACRSC